MAARRTVVQTVALPWIDATRVVVVGHVGRKARVFLGRSVGAFRHIPAPRAPDVLAECAVFSDEGGDRVRADHAARPLVGNAPESGNAWSGERVCRCVVDEGGG